MPVISLSFTKVVYVSDDPWLHSFNRQSRKLSSIIIFTSATNFGCWYPLIPGSHFIQDRILIFLTMLRTFVLLNFVTERCPVGTPNYSTDPKPPSSLYVLHSTSPSINLCERNTIKSKLCSFVTSAYIIQMSRSSVHWNLLSITNEEIWKFEPNW